MQRATLRRRIRSLLRGNNVTALPVGAPPAPNGIRFYGNAVAAGRYRLQTTEIVSSKVNIWDRYGWGVDVNGKRVLCLFALPVNGIYSTPTMRRAMTLEERRNCVLRAVCYLLQDCPADLRVAINMTLARPDPIPMRYQYVNTDSSFCIIFINDVTRLLHCELPNNPDRTLVRDMYDWVRSEGIASAFGWKALSNGLEAQQAADVGRVVVMFRIANTKDAHENLVWDDHVALVLPSGNTAARVVGGATWPRVAQAGKDCGSNLDSYNTFYQDASHLKFFAHD